MIGIHAEALCALLGPMHAAPGFSTNYGSATRQVIPGAESVDRGCSCSGCTCLAGSWQDFSRQARYMCTQGKRRSELLNKWLQIFPPRMHRWQLARWSEPAAWHAARLAFTRTAAVWSMVTFSCHCDSLPAQPAFSCLSAVPPSQLWALGRLDSFM